MTSNLEPRLVRAGPLSLLLTGGDLRYIELVGHEVLRRVYVAIRGPNWETIEPAYANVRLQADGGSFALSFDAENVGFGIDFAWHGFIRGQADGTITYEMEGEARADFRKNRIGFCVLHPMATAGATCLVRHADGSIEQSLLPRLISPYQPFFSIASIAHEVSPGVVAEVRFDGDTFEMEDQRNWTDASFKTYGTPLSLPYPMTVARGTRIAQSIALTLSGAVPAPRAEVIQDLRPAIELHLDTTARHPLPALGLGVASHQQPLSETEVEYLRKLKLRHLRADLDLTSAGAEAALQAAALQARALAVPLELALHVSDQAERELIALLQALWRERPAMARWLVFHQQEKATSAIWIRRARRILAQYDAAVPVGGGSNAYFAELNRNRPDSTVMDVVAYPITPQVHAFDNASLVETLAAQAATLWSARQFCRNVPLAVTPITLRPRFNADATGPEPAQPPDNLPSKVDVRQLSLFAAAWTLGSLKYCAEGGAASLTYYETTGWQGVMERAAGSPLPATFPSSAGMPFPLYHVLAAAGEFAGGQMLRVVSSHPLKVEGLALSDGARVRILLANLTGEDCRVRLRGMGGDTVRVAHLAVHGLGWVMGEPMPEDAFGDGTSMEDREIALDLLPFELVRIDESGSADITARAAERPR